MRALLRITTPSEMVFLATWLACRGLSDCCRSPSHFSLLAQREVTQRKGLGEHVGAKSVDDRSLPRWFATHRVIAAARPRPLGNHGKGGIVASEIKLATLSCN